MFADTAVFIDHDGQRFEGRAAIIRRLNAGGCAGLLVGADNNGQIRSIAP